jgi:hypothetical protein
MMFSHEEHEPEVQNKPQFEAGFNRGGDIIVNITKKIDSVNTNTLILTIDEWIDKFYNVNNPNRGCKVVCIFDAYGEDYSCVKTFQNYMKNTIEKKPKVTFVGIVTHAEGSVSYMYMIMPERIVKSDEKAQTQSGIVRMGQSSLKFSVVSPEVKNEIAKMLFENKIDKKIIPLCFPQDEKSCVQYCGEIIADYEFGIIQSD